jgi:hypothetical protein
MKKLNFAFLFLITLFFSGCSNDDNNSSLPECLEDTKTIVYQDEPQTPRASIDKYIYNGETVYLFNRNTSDYMSDAVKWVIDEQCIVLCHIESNFEQNNCIDWESAQFVETVWTDPR